MAANSYKNGDNSQPFPGIAYVLALFTGMGNCDIALTLASIGFTSLWPTT